MRDRRLVNHQRNEKKEVSDVKNMYSSKVLEIIRGIMSAQVETLDLCKRAFKQEVNVKKTAFPSLRRTNEAEHHERLRGFLMRDPGGFQQRHLEDKIPT